MTHFLLEYRYVDQEARASVRPEHLAYMNRLQREGAVVLAGPIVDADQGVVVLRVADEEAAREVIRHDPYTAAHATADHTLRAWNVVIPAQS